MKRTTRGIRVASYLRRRRSLAKKSRLKEITHPAHIKRVVDWEFDGDEVHLQDRGGKTIDTLYLDSLIDEWMIEAKREGWVSYDPDETYYVIDGEAATLYDERDEVIDELDLDSLVSNWLLDAGWRPPR